MSHVEAFATGIKIESSDQSPFWGLIKVTSELLKSMDQEHRRERIKQLSTLFANQKP